MIVEGEVAQLAASRQLETTIDEYINIVNAKTAVLFAAAAAAGPALHGAARPLQMRTINMATIWAWRSKLPMMSWIIRQIRGRLAKTWAMIFVKVK